MAITASTLDRAERTLYYRVNRHNVPVQLPFDLLTIDGQQYYQPMTYRMSEKGKPPAGAATGAVYLQANRPLPVGEDVAVWSYYGL